MGNIAIGGGAPVTVQSMLNTKTTDVDACLKQISELIDAGCDLIRIAVPDENSATAFGIIAARTGLPLIADIHYNYKLAHLALDNGARKIRMNPGNMRDFGQIKELARRMSGEGIPVRVGVNGGSLHPDYKTMDEADALVASALDCAEVFETCGLKDIVVAIKASDVKVMTEANRKLAAICDYPLHLGVTEAGTMRSGLIKSALGIGTLLQEGIGDTIRVSLTEDPGNELPVARYLALHGADASQGGDEMLDAAIKWGPKLLKREIDAIPESAGLSEYLVDEVMQASRRRFYKPEYIACPGCGRTMYDLQKTFEEVKARTSHLKGMVIAVMGCIVNGPGEMADADWGYVGEGGGRVSIYRKGQPVLRHVPDSEAIDRLLELIEAEA